VHCRLARNTTVWFVAPSLSSRSQESVVIDNPSEAGLNDANGAISKFPIGAEVELAASRFLARITCMNLARIRPEQTLQKTLENCLLGPLDYHESPRTDDNQNMHELL